MGQQHVDLVITDHAMPSMTGAQLADTLQATAASLPIIIATGFAELPGGGAAKYRRLAKPFGQPELGRASQTARA